MLPAAGVPAKVAVSSPLSTKVTPEGRAPDSESVMSGVCMCLRTASTALTWKVPDWPTLKVVAAAEVIVGGSAIVSTKAWLVSGWVPLLAVMDKE